MAEATISFTFTTDAAGEKDPETGEVSQSISAEVSAEDNIGEDGKGTTEAKYDKPLKFRVYTMPPGLAYTITASDGNVSPESGSGVGSFASVEDKIQFSGKNEGTTSKPVYGGKLSGAPVWLGKSLGAIGVSGNNVVTASQAGVAIAKIRYTTQYQSHTFLLPNRGVDDYEVIIYIKSADEETC